VSSPGSTAGAGSPERRVALLDGRELVVRPVRPDDAPLLRAMLERTSPEDLRLRFFASMRRVPEATLERLMRQGPGELALAAIDPEDGAFQGVVRIATDPEHRAEYAVLVRSDMKGKGLGWRLMEAIIAHARERGVRELHGLVLRDNRGMLQMCEELGFERRSSPDDPGLVEVGLALSP
jgi:acetyltransferase